ncbi:hypothetical protein GLOTRDRAFT_130007 [Gloeophyllum trabeum ATCC 11539]|uniref:SP-RING-type domain-containing protein n=1 Tax=Gloeophyllum trabeum (strain ATCC 11539 / FP-39264 / Madison 617) TaxID=670483 RepID=S7Q3S5_GLOTA|nr:uncharacterized protein GLOTRDRAFT_130007 [Gloeophyllum trabeum ATCC 11539]EPQ54656.1 hypothetical protein GLOTRDRAFT_130007 [Gloeophyllum trabeum ATCC 11539]
MPAAGTSRRRSRREPVEEPVAEDQGADAQEDIEEEERPARRSSKVVKKEVKSARIKVDESDDEKDEQVEGRIDVTNFKDQPLDVKEGTKLGGLASDWATMAKTLNSSAFNALKELAPSMAEAVDGDEGSKSLIELESTMRDLIDLESEMGCYEKTLDELHQLVIQGEKIDDVMSRYEENLAANIDEYKAKTSRQKYGKHQAYVDFRQRIFEVQQPGQAMPPINDFLPKEDGDDSDDDDEIEIGGMTQDYKCPLTLTILVNPLTSKHCHHSFSAEAIRDYLKRGPKTCPAAGCKQQLTLDDLEEDKDLARRAQAAARREARREQDSDADEVVE